MEKHEGAECAGAQAQQPQADEGESQRRRECGGRVGAALLGVNHGACPGVRGGLVGVTRLHSPLPPQAWPAHVNAAPDRGRWRRLAHANSSLAFGTAEV